MYGRRSVWSDPKVQEACKSFVCVADEVYSLHNGRGPECDLFRALAKDGYARGVSNVSQQGLYVFTPAGELLGSDNTRDPERALRLMKTSLARWDRVPKEKRIGSLDPSKWKRNEDSYPTDGLVLRQYTRDLGENRRILGDYQTPWNTDLVWFSSGEARQMVPARPRVGQKHRVPETLMRRLARLHLIDSVLGQGLPFQDRSVGKADLTGEVVEVKDGAIVLKLTGRTSAAQDRRGMDLELLGRAVYDPERKRFRSFDLIATGTRTGTRGPGYIRNNRESGSIGFSFALAGDKSYDRAAPALFGAYGWR